MNGTDRSSGGRRARHRSWAPDSVLFVLPVRGGSGGANSVIQEAMGMRSMGVDAKVATHVRYRDAFSHFYSKPFESGDHFVFFDSDDELSDLAAPYQVIVATLWSTPRLILPISWRWPEKLYVYYIQDYEPWFFPDDPESRQIATDSYTLIPNMVLMAKTDWICRTVRERHGRHVYRVAPSLDHDVYFPNERRDTADAPVRIAAMIRPTTPRRGPVRTLRVLQKVADRLQNGVQILLFGCEPRNLQTFLSQNAPDINLGKDFENRGQLTRDGVAELLRDADIFVDLSDYQAFGRTGLEAMACGCAVVLPATGGVYEYAVNGHNCLVADTRSMDEMTETILRLLMEPATRATITQNGIQTASGFNIQRASLSELSVFRLAAAAKQARRSARGAEYGRGLDPVDSSADASKVSVLLPPAGNQAAADTLVQRVLAPLRCKAAKDKVEIREIRSAEELKDDPGDVCIVYRGVIRTPHDAEKVIDQCQQLGVPLAYGTDVGPSADCPRMARTQSILIGAADRIVVPSITVRQDPALVDHDATIVAAAFDEELWLGRQTHYSPRADTSTEVSLLVYGDSNVDRLLVGIWNRVKPAAGREVSLDVAATGELDLNGSNAIPRGQRPYAEFARSILAAGEWDIALLLADDHTAAADQRFLTFAALGLAIVCSNEGPHLQLARHRENALIVENTEDAWTHGILELIGARNLRRELGQRAKQDAETRRGLNQSAFAFLQAYVLPATGKHHGAKANAQDLV